MNKNLEIVCDELFSIPKDRGNVDFVEFIEDIFGQFKNRLDDFEGKVAQEVQSRKSLIIQLCDKIVECLKCYHRGPTFGAYQIFNDGLNALLADSTVFDPANYIHYNSNLKRLYRARISEDILSQRTEMFHPPSYLRHVLADQRYSIRGLPCLYLANSSYICWEELGRPDIKDFWVSRFELDRIKLPILYLNPTSEFFKLSYQRALDPRLRGSDICENLIPRFLTKWPLQVATSVNIAKQYASTNFKPEYIIPQFLMEWVRTNDKFVGICYPTTKDTMADNIMIGDMVNYAIPADDIREDGFCRSLSEHLKMTSPVSIGMMQMLQIRTDVGNLEKAMNPSMNEDFNDFPGHFDLAVSSDIRQPYAHTMFGTLEAYLHSLSAKPLTD